jgi:hypothetical protein
MTETVDEKNKRLLKAGFDFFERLAKDPENNMFSNAIEVGRLIEETEDRVAAEYQERIRQLEAKTQMALGVGDGSGQLFVHGDYESIKATQKIIFDSEEKTRRIRQLEEALRFYEEHARNCRKLTPEGQNARSWLHADGGEAASRALEAKQ